MHVQKWEAEQIAEHNLIHMPSSEAEPFDDFAATPPCANSSVSPSDADAMERQNYPKPSCTMVAKLSWAAPSDCGNVGSQASQVSVPIRGEWWVLQFNVASTRRVLLPYVKGDVPFRGFTLSVFLPLLTHSGCNSCSQMLQNALHSLCIHLDGLTKLVANSGPIIHWNLSE